MFVEETQSSKSAFHEVKGTIRGNCKIKHGMEQTVDIVEEITVTSSVVFSKTFKQSLKFKDANLKLWKSYVLLRAYQIWNRFRSQMGRKKKGSTYSKFFDKNQNFGKEISEPILSKEKYTYGIWKTKVKQPLFPLNLSQIISKN